MSDQITLPSVSVADLDPVATLVAAVGWPHRRADIAALIELGHGRLARAGDGRTLGVGLWWPFGDTAARLGLVVVSPDSQGLGIGRRLAERLLADAAPRSVMLLATRAGRPLYERLGFVEVGAVCQHQGEYSAGRHPDPGSARRPPRIGLPCCAWTRPYSVSRGRPSSTTCWRSAGPSCWSRTAEWPATPSSAPSAADRLSVRWWRRPRPMRSPYSTPLRVRASCASTGRWRRPNFGRHLTACGLGLDSKSPAMLRGDWPAATAPQRIYALASHALG